MKSLQIGIVIMIIHIFIFIFSVGEISWEDFMHVGVQFMDIVMMFSY